MTTLKTCLSSLIGGALSSTTAVTLGGITGWKVRRSLPSTLIHTRHHRGEAKDPGGRPEEAVHRGQGHAVAEGRLGEHIAPQANEELTGRCANASGSSLLPFKLPFKLLINDIGALIGAIYHTLATHCL